MSVGLCLSSLIFTDWKSGCLLFEAFQFDGAVAGEKVAVVKSLNEGVASGALPCACIVGDGVSSDSEKIRTVRKGEDDVLVRRL